MYNISHFQDCLLLSYYEVFFVGASVTYISVAFAYILVSCGPHVLLYLYLHLGDLLILVSFLLEQFCVIRSGRVWPEISRLATFSTR